MGSGVIKQVPQLHDGGYFYTVPIVPDPLEGGQTPGDVGEFAGVYYANGYAVFRKVEPMIIPDDGTGPADLPIAGKPFGRLRGR